MEIDGFRGQLITDDHADYDTVPHGWHYYWKATSLAGLTDDVIDLVADHAYRAGSPRSYCAMFHMGGAVGQVPRDATAYGGRDVGHNMSIDGVWLPDESGEHAAAFHHNKNIHPDCGVPEVGLSL